MVVGPLHVWAHTLYIPSICATYAPALNTKVMYWKAVIIQVKRTLCEGLSPPPPSRSCISYWDKDASSTKESEIQILQYNEVIIYRVAANGYVRMQPN